MKEFFERYAPLLALIATLLPAMASSQTDVARAWIILLLAGTLLGVLVLLGWVLLLLQMLLWLGRQDYLVIRQYGSGAQWTVSYEGDPYVQRDTLAECIALIKEQRREAQIISEAIANGKVSSAA